MSSLPSLKTNAPRYISGDNGLSQELLSESQSFQDRYEGAGLVRKHPLPVSDRLRVARCVFGNLRVAPKSDANCEALWYRMIRAASTSTPIPYEPGNISDTELFVGLRSSQVHPLLDLLDGEDPPTPPLPFVAALKALAEKERTNVNESIWQHLPGDTDREKALALLEGMCLWLAFGEAATPPFLKSLTQVPKRVWREITQPILSSAPISTQEDWRHALMDKIRILRNAPTYIPPWERAQRNASAFPQKLARFLSRGQPWLVDQLFDVTQGLEINPAADLPWLASRLWIDGEIAVPEEPATSENMWRCLQALAKISGFEQAFALTQPQADLRESDEVSMWFQKNIPHNHLMTRVIAALSQAVQVPFSKMLVRAFPKTLRTDLVALPEEQRLDVCSGGEGEVHVMHSMLHRENPETTEKGLRIRLSSTLYIRLHRDAGVLGVDLKIYEPQFEGCAWPERQHRLRSLIPDGNYCWQQEN